ncbi:MAG: diguanylate cyclase domain-containing protein [Acidimicrobiales bacterium]
MADREIDEQFLADIVDHSIDPYAVIAVDGTVLYVSESIGQVLGGVPADYVGRHIVETIHPTSVARAIDSFSEFVSPRKPDTGWVGPALSVDLSDIDGNAVGCRILSVPSGDPDFDGLVLRIRSTRTNAKLDAAIHSIVKGDDIADTLTLLLDFAHEQMPYSIGAVGLGWDGREFASVVADPLAPVLDPSSGRHLVGAEPSPWRAVLDGDESATLDCDELPPHLADVVIDSGFPACWAFALSERRPARDALVMWRRAPGPPGPHLAEAVDRIRRLMQLTIESHRSRQVLERQANTDELTGLANRSAFFARLEELRIRPPLGHVGILYCDLDEFKPVNDQHGHTLGDRVLSIAAHRLTSQVRSGDLVARLGGDEFAIVCTGADADDIANLANRLVVSFRQPINVDRMPISLGISVGSALLDPTADLEDVDAAVDRADRALLRAKANGKDRWEPEEV